MIVCSRLYEICDDKNINVEECARVDWHMGFRRMMTSEDYEEWTGLQRLLTEVKISNNTNEVKISNNTNEIAWASHQQRTSQQIPIQVHNLWWDQLQDGKKNIEISASKNKDFHVAGLSEYNSDGRST
jgi:Tfp pilus assembly protein FimT